MEHYINLTILPDAEFPETTLMNAVYSKFHKTLCDLKSNNIGVSFPNYGLTLGNMLRIHSSESELKRFHEVNWLGGMSGYCSTSTILLVPADVKHRTISRVQPNMTEAKLRRLINRGSISQHQVDSYRKKMHHDRLSNPYLQLSSGSNGHKHRRYLNFGKLQDEPITGQFDQFGLSKVATVPWFS